MMQRSGNIRFDLHARSFMAVEFFVLYTGRTRRAP